MITSNKFKKWGNQLIFKPHILMGMSLLRILIGLLLLHFVIVHYFQRYALWSDAGYLSHDTFVETTPLAPFSIFQYNPSLIYLDIIFHLGILVIILFTVGYKGRIMSVLTFIFIYSLYDRNAVILDGGDNLLRLIIFFMIFAYTTAYFSVDASKHKHNKVIKAKLQDFPMKLPYTQRFKVLLHNLAVASCALQLIIIYFVSGLYQVMGDMWHEGTAIYYVTQVEQYYIPSSIGDFLLSNEILMTAFTLGSVLIKLAFPFMLFNKYTKYIAIFIMASFHLGILFTMGLVTMSISMIAIELIFISDKEYKGIKPKLLQLLRRINMQCRYLTRPLRRRHVRQRKTLLVFYDSWCPLCLNTVNKIRQIDYLNLIRFYSLRDDKLMKEYSIDVAKAEREMYCYIPDQKKIEAGNQAFLEISKRIIPLHAFVPFLWIGKITGLGDTIYSFVANRRGIIPVNQCKDDCFIEESDVKFERNS